MARARLLLLNSSGDVSQEFEIGRPNIVIGRSPQSNILISDNEISRIHAQIVNTPHGFFIADMGSTNGTYLNGEFIRPKQMIELKSNDQVNLGQLGFLFQLVSDSIPAPHLQYASPARSDREISSNQNSLNGRSSNKQYKSNQVALAPQEIDFSSSLLGSHNPPIVQPRFHENTNNIARASHSQNQSNSPQNHSPYQTNQQTYSQHPYVLPIPDLIYQNKAQDRKASVSDSVDKQSNYQARQNQPFNQVPSDQKYPTSANNRFAQQVPSLSEREINASAQEILIDKTKKENEAKAQSGISWAGWGKTNVFDKKNAQQKNGEIKENSTEANLANLDGKKKSINNLLNDFTEEDLVETVFGQNSKFSSSLEIVPVSKQSANKANHEQDTFIDNNDIEFEEDELMDSTDLSKQSIKYKIESTSYYYPETAPESARDFPPEGYAYSDATEVNKSRDPFQDLNFKDNDSFFAKFRGNPFKKADKAPLDNNNNKTPLSTLINQEVSKDVEKKDFPIFIKKYGIPLSLGLIAIVALGMFLIRNIAAFG